MTWPRLSRLDWGPGEKGLQLSIVHAIVRIHLLRRRVTYLNIQEKLRYIREYIILLIYTTWITTYQIFSQTCDGSMEKLILSNSHVPPNRSLSAVLKREH